MKRLALALSLAFSSYGLYADVWNAVENNRLEDLKVCIANGEDINKPRKKADDKDFVYLEGCTLLMEAAGRCHLDAVRLLLDANADVNATAGADYEGETLVVNALNLAIGVGLSDDWDLEEKTNPKKRAACLE